MNRILYLILNIFWGTAILLALPDYFIQLESFSKLVTVIILLCVVTLQFLGGYKLYKGFLLLPIIACSIFVFSFDFQGIKLFISNTIYFYIEIKEGLLIINTPKMF